ncbi:MarR family transcriptional regulator [Mucilaginibacter sp. BJC16-A38]|uniref:MarR family winged helix-turn-helix transcriptional regulator n=1 Tax=Mucilaginibacter phenanthrenivorans TaxID=1234842 RepID=UPI002157E878|nr:MarR family transcriptional regulator [Mucilaginibacter phenanthrenivorans]MCR8558311.1 MarR family transcriptional regulator [Mucilaginibacter phenanthrenivorans]
MQPLKKISKSLKHASLLYNKLLYQQLAGMGLDNYAEILLIISDSEQPLSQNQLAELFQIDKSRMVNILFKLSQNDFITIKQDPDDRRRHNIYLTPKARKIIPEIENILNNTTTMASNGIPSEKLDCCIDVLEIMRKNLSTILAKKTIKMFNDATL